jgi:hypothetical protein
MYTVRAFEAHTNLPQYKRSYSEGENVKSQEVPSFITKPRTCLTEEVKVKLHLLNIPLI